MNFEIDTKAKTVTMLEAMTLLELQQLKTWIGDGWEKWTLVAKPITLKEDRWYPYPYTPAPVYPLQPYYTGDPIPQRWPEVWCDTNDAIDCQRYKITMAKGDHNSLGYGGLDSLNCLLQHGKEV